MSAEVCPTCGLPVVDYHPYAETLGGHADRHTLVLEAADQALLGDPA